MARATRQTDYFLVRPDPENSRHETPENSLDRLRRDGNAFNFFQAVRLLERYGFPDDPRPGEGASYEDERVRFRPHVGSSFPLSSLHSIETKKDTKGDLALLTCWFDGLYGIGSPLPRTLHQHVQDDDDSARALRDFYDLFNNRFYAFFYRSWKKYRFLHSPTSTEGRALHHRLGAIAGVGTPGARRSLPVDIDRLIPYAGRLAGGRRSAEGLETVLVDLLTVPVEILENMPRWVKLPNRPRIGRGANSISLGENSTIGEGIFDLSGKFRVIVGPVNLEKMLRLLPNEAEAIMTQRVVRMYAPDFLDFDVELRLETDDVRPVALGDGQGLGLTTFLGKPHQSIVSRIVNYPEATMAA